MLLAFEIWRETRDVAPNCFLTLPFSVIIRDTKGPLKVLSRPLRNSQIPTIFGLLWYLRVDSEFLTFCFDTQTYTLEIIRL